MTRKSIRTLPAGRHADSGQNGTLGLYLNVTATGYRSWIGRTKIAGKTHSFGLGSLRDVDLDEARDVWRDIRRRIRNGEDPAAIKKRGKPGETFADMARRAYAARAPRLKDAKASQWLTSLEQHMGPLWAAPIGHVTAPALLDQLSPLVATKTETARKLIGRVGATFDYAIALGVVAANPAPAVRSAAPWPAKRVEHHAAVPWQEAPALFARIRALDTVGSAALIVTILTGSRGGAVRHMTPEQIDGDTWTAPADIMKMSRAYDYPLTPVAKTVVDRYAAIADPWLFRGMKGKPISDMTMLKVLRDLGTPYTVHGWRSTLTDWARDTLHIDDEMIDALLAHTKEAKRIAYARSDLLDRRRAVQLQWEAYLCKNAHV
ncbi:integrase arm-type DNA-binding domain-containing protein [Ruegeria sp. WL0004]|uniref:Integrase arm-type DNA-binding domain-containing protein n=1 Tax=Ruegeria marisflavi TaxID=2984152 RepID=A0ABT2WPJ9_9RHOB|nr:integrase arm-type DNA-binding domain-containing protein [Ruegeria sp. WL0004]MCU9837162.1 integrase arm-type DNA-binding domain-containing protein [Ruegeria sp. WL0004]